ncbi:MULTISPECIES: hybrid sensor histidine kinase/response regulator [Cyanophyceae]|uniref:hybrid sensor histidine kinase/response regulator n=1 Tax=Cyanophyceae TaxID=3028117 RepID=UPI0018EF4BBC|nr:response regulator [Trichocoleus sp. FACHB-40]
MQPEQQQRIMGYFIEEAKDHLNTIEQGLMNLQSTIEDPEMVNEVFRAAHSVKGGAAMLGLNSIQKASHRLEDSFKILKECPVKIDQKLESLFLRVSDTLKELIEQLSGPFGLTEDIANSIMSGVEPVFEELNQHMALLVGGAGGMALEAANGTKAETPMVMSAQYAGSSVRDGQAQKSVFTSDVLSQLREMLQLFKQPDSARCREKLQEICGSLELLGEQFELPKWSQLIRTTGSAIANPENSYRTLASVVIKEIKQAQELVLAGRETSIEPSSQLKALIPLTAVVATGETHEADNYLHGAIATFEPAHQTSDRTVLAVEAGNLHNHHAAIDGDRYADTPIQEEIVASVSSGATSWQEQALSPDVDNMFFEPANNKGRSKESATHRADPSGPEVGMAELNSLADLFEGESPELDETWQEEEVLSDVGHDLVNERHGESDFDEEGDSFDDFSDLLGDSLSGVAKPSATATGGDELTNLFGEDFVDEATVDEQPSLQSVDDGFADMLFEDDSSLNTTSEDLSSLWDDNFIDEEESDSPEIATTATEATELSDEDLVVILAADNVEMAVAAADLEESFGEDGNAVGTDTDENESIFDAAPDSLESFDFELTGETSDNELEDWDTQPVMSTTEPADDWTADWSSEDLQILDGVSETEPSLTNSPEDWSDSMFADELNADAALSDNLNGGMMANDESWTTDAGWEEEPDFSNLNLFETPVATPESQNVLEELVLDENGDLWLEENGSTAEELEAFGLDGVGEAMPDEDAIASSETNAVNDVNLDFNWPFTSNTEDTNPADTENGSAADLAWDTIDNPVLSESTSADEDPNSQEFNQTQLEDPLSALDNLEIPSEWAAGDPFALSETSETATTTDALELLDLDSPHPSPFNMDWDSAAESATPEENVNEYLDEPLNLDFTELNEETPHTPLDNFFSEEPEATETSDWDSSLDLTGFNLSEANTDEDAFDTTQDENITELFDTNLSESATLPSSDDLFNRADTSLESSVFDDAENSLVVFDTEPSSSTDALDWNEQNLLSTETDPDWEIPSATVPPIEAENIESMFGEDLSATTEALELSDEDLFASDDMNAEWDMSSMAPVEAENLDNMFGEDLSATPAEMDNMFGEDLSGTTEALELSESGLFASDDMNAEWDMSLMAPVEAEMDDMFGEDMSLMAPVEAEMDDMFGEDLSATPPVEAEMDNMFGEDLSAMPAAEAEMDDMFGEDLSGTTQALELDNLDDMFGEDLSATPAEMDNMFGEDLSAMPAAAEMDDMFGEDLSATPTEMDNMFGEDLSGTSEALELSESGLFASDDMNAEWDMSSMAPVEAEMDNIFGEDLSATPTEMDNMFGEDLSATTQALELDNLDNMFGEDLSAIPAAEAEMDDMFGENLSATTQALELDNLDDMFGEDLSAMPTEMDNMFGEDLSGTTEALELSESGLFASDDMDMNAEWDMSSMPAAAEMDDMFGEDLSATPAENLDNMFGEDLSGTTQALELENLDNMFGEDLSATPAEMDDMFGEDLSGTTEALELSESGLFASDDMDMNAEWDMSSMPAAAEMDNMFGEDLSATPAEMDDMFGEDLSGTTEGLELSESGLFASDDMNAEWDMSSMPAAAEMDDMFGEDLSATPTQMDDMFGEDLSATPTQMDDMFGEDLSATPLVEAENLGDMFGEDLSVTTQSLELENLDDMFGEDLSGTTEDLFASDDMNAEWDISPAAMSPTESLEDMFGEDVSATNEALDLDADNLLGSELDADWDMLSAAVPEDADLTQADLLGVEPAEIGDMLDFEEDLFTAQMPSQDLAIATNQLNQIEALWGLTAEEENEIETSETTEGLSTADFNSLSFEEDKVSTAEFLGADEFDELDSLLGEDAIGDQITPDLVLNNEFDELDSLLGEQETASADILDEFADLEALLGDEPQAITPKAKQASKSAAPASNTIDDEFGDLEILLGQAEETMGVPRSAKTSSSPVRPVNRTRQIKVFEQTMRVPVKHLDNLSNLVGELVVNRNTLEQDQERLRQFLDNLLHQVQQLSDVGARMQDRYERSLLESSLLASRQGNRFNPRGDRDSQSQDNTPPNSRFGLGELELDLFTPFHTLSQEIIELIVRVRESAADIEFLVDETDQVARMLRQITSQLQEGLTRSRMVPFANTADRLPRAVRDISIRCGKQAELHIEGRETLLDKVILEHLSDPMTHLINNAITHGIETPEVRKAAGKPPVGRITIRAFHQGNQTVISVSDDGAGVDAERVKSKAIEKGLITPDQATTMTRLDVYDLLFHPGFTTKDKEDEFAGRGIGMNVVRENLTEIRGVINTDSTLGKGTTFTVRLPLTLSICKALCCLIDRTRIAFPMDGVEDMLDVPQERIQTNAEGQTCIYWRDSLMPFQPLSELLTYNRHLSRGNVYGGKRDDDMISVVVLRSSGNYIAVQVDQVLGEQEIVIKQLEGPVPKPLGVAGATVLGDGRIMPIADVLELIDLATGRIGKDRGVSLWDKSGVPAPVEVPEVKTDPMVLIVDDSITVRELLSMTFNKAGYRVEQARDGQEAWDKLRSGLPCEIVFCDIEMPRMDGLELLSRIQKDPTLSHLPVAMLTSRGASKHQQMAAQFGAKGYFTKPYLEEVLLDAAQRMIKGEVLLSINSNA